MNPPPATNRTRSGFELDDWIDVAQQHHRRPWSTVEAEADLFAAAAACEALNADRDGEPIHNDPHERAAVLALWLTRRPPLQHDNDAITCAAVIRLLSNHGYRWTDVTIPAGWEAMLNDQHTNVQTVQRWLRHRTRKETPDDS